LGVDQEVAAPEPSIITRVAYGVSQLPRVVWYLGHGLALRRLAEAARRDNGAKARLRIHTSAPVPDRARLYADMARLFLQDLANIEAGIYPLPFDHDGSLLTLLIARACSSRICLRSIDGAKGEDIARFSIKIRAVSGRATICRISTINPAAG
jgi:hypothetical protein